MAQATNISTISPSRFHNLANTALADALGHADAVLKGAEASLKSPAANSRLQPPSRSPVASTPRL
jgi:hypothetical protein